MRSSLVVVLALVIATRSIPAAAAAPRQDVENLLDVATILMRDSHLDRAAAVLAEITIERPEARPHRMRYFTLDGMVALRRGDVPRAQLQLQRAIDAGQRKPSAYLLLAQAHARGKRWRAALAALANVGSDLGQLPGVLALRASCQRAAGVQEGAWRTFVEARRRHPHDLALARQQLLFLLELGLYQQALPLGRRFVAHANVKSRDVVAVAEAMRRAGQHQQAIVALEGARLRFGDDPELLQQLARSYVDAGMGLAAAELMARAAMGRPTLASDAAELYRRAGRLHTALFFNAQVADQKVKLRQRVALLIELERYEQIGMLASRLSRLGLLEDEPLRYALAYALFRSGRLAASERWLAGVKDPLLFRKAVALRRAMASCKAKAGPCS